MIKASPRMIGSIIAIAAIAVAIAVAAIVWRPAIAAIDPPAPQSFDGAWSSAAAISRRSATATTVTRRAAGQRILPAAWRCRRRSAPSIPPTSRRTRRPGSAAGRRPRSAAPCVEASTATAGISIRPFPTIISPMVTDEDNRALYAYLMTREPVRAPAPRQPAAVSARSARVLAGWKLLFLRHGTYQPDPAKTRNGIAAPIWSRDWPIAAPATRRAMRSARKRPARAFAGGDAEDWHAYAINAQSPAPVPWNADALFDYLRDGWHRTMAWRAARWRRWSAICLRLPESDVRAIATYMAGVFGRADAGTPAPWRRCAGAGRIACRRRRATTGRSPARRSTPPPARPAMRARGLCPMAASISRSARPSRPRSAQAANVVLSGDPPVGGQRGPIMPGFAGA